MSGSHVTLPTCHVQGLARLDCEPVVDAECAGGVVVTKPAGTSASHNQSPGLPAGTAVARPARQCHACARARPHLGSQHDTTYTPLYLHPAGSPQAWYLPAGRPAGDASMGAGQRAARLQGTMHRQACRGPPHAALKASCWRLAAAPEHDGHLNGLIASVLHPYLGAGVWSVVVWHGALRRRARLAARPWLGRPHQRVRGHQQCFRLSMGGGWMRWRTVWVHLQGRDRAQAHSMTHDAPAGGAASWRTGRGGTQAPARNLATHAGGDSRIFWWRARAPWRRAEPCVPHCPGGARLPPARPQQTVPSAGGDPSTHRKLGQGRHSP